MQVVQLRKNNSKQVMIQPKTEVDIVISDQFGLAFHVWVSMFCTHFSIALQEFQDNSSDIIRNDRPITREN